MTYKYLVRAIPVFLLCVGCGGGGGSAISVRVSPSSATVALGATKTFAATVRNTPVTTVTWSVQEGAAGGTISADGLYTAPAVVGVYHVIAASTADPTKTFTSTVTVPVGVAVSPTTATMTLSDTQTFTSTVTGSTNTDVVWSIQEGSAGGTITSAGLYKAPLSGGTFRVVATSAALPKGTATATVTVTVGSGSGTIK